MGTYTINATSWAAGISDGGGGYVSCPVGQRIVTGGAGWRTPGDPFVPSLASNTWISGTSPTTNAKGWYGAGAAYVPGVVLRVVALCRPKSSVGTYSAKTLTIPASESDAGSYLSCATGKRVVAMGAFWHAPGSAPDPASSDSYYLSSATPTSDAKGMYGAGLSRHPGTQDLTLALFCRPK